jgi:hypothetical protein
MANMERIGGRRPSPDPDHSGYDALVAAGRIAAGSGRDPDTVLRKLDADLPPDKGPSVSAALAKLRDDER